MLLMNLIAFSKTALNYAKVFGMEKAMGLKGQQFSTAASIASRGPVAHVAKERN